MKRKPIVSGVSSYSKDPEILYELKIFSAAWKGRPTTSIATVKEI